jgi:predicted PurR-regulated permease PerM
MNTPQLSSTSLLTYVKMIFFSILVLYFGKTLFIPLFFGLLIAMILYPVCKWLEINRCAKWIAITVCLAIVALLFGMIMFLLSWQLKTFGKDAHQLVYAAEQTMLRFQAWLGEYFRLANNEIWTINNMIPGIGNFIKSTLQITISTLFMLFLTPVFTALFLYHRALFVNFLKNLLPLRYKQKMDIILRQTIVTYFNYIKGMILVYLIVGILNSLGLYALGVRNAVLFGMLCAVMTIIPYIGIFLSALMPISVVWLDTGNIWYPLGVVGVFGFVQYLEANVIFPKVVGAQLRVSTFAMLVAILVGGIIWGAAGMVLFIPFVAIFKIISENVEEWKPVHMLLTR